MGAGIPGFGLVVWGMGGLAAIGLPLLLVGLVVLVMGPLRWLAPDHRAYWAVAIGLILFGILGAMTIGLPFLLIGLAMLLLSPFRRRPLAFWPLLLGFAALNLSFLLIAPANCEASSGPSAAGDFAVMTQTSCSSLTGIPWPIDAAGSGASGGAFGIAGLIAISIGVVVFVGVLTWQWIERDRCRAAGGGAGA